MRKFVALCLAFLPLLVLLGCGEDEPPALVEPEATTGAEVVPEPAAHPLYALVDAGPSPTAAGRIDVSQLRASPAFQQLVAWAHHAAQEEPEEPSEDLDWMLDLIERTDEVLGIFYLSPEDGEEVDLILARGRFRLEDAERIATNAPEPAQKSERAGSVIWRHDTEALAAIGEHTLAFGTAAAVTRVVDRAAAPLEPEVRTGALGLLLAREDLGARTIALAVDVAQTRDASRMSNGGDVPEMAREVDGLVMGIDLAPGLDVDARATTTRPAVAEELRAYGQAQLDRVRGEAVVGMFGLGPVLDGITLTTDGVDLHASIVLSAETVDRLLSALSNLVEELFGEIVDGLGEGAGSPAGGGTITAEPL